MNIIEQLRDAAKWTRDGKAGGKVFVGPELLDTAAGEIERLRQALEDVVNPLVAMKRWADAEGRQLNGMAYQIANELGHVQGIARTALASTHK